MKKLVLLFAATTVLAQDPNPHYTEVGLVNANGNGLGVDLSTRSLQTIDYAHHEIHAGSTYRVQHNDDAIPATASSGELVIAFTVPDQAKEPHMTWEFIHEGNMTMTVYEGVTIATNGTARSVKNSNRNSSNTSILQGWATGAAVSNSVSVGEESADSIYSGGTVISLKQAQQCQIAYQSERKAQTAFIVVVQ